MPKIAVPISSVVRERLSHARYTMTGTSRAYRTANNIDGAKSVGKRVPPTGVGKGMAPKAKRAEQRKVWATTSEEHNTVLMQEARPVVIRLTSDRCTA